VGYGACSKTRLLIKTFVTIQCWAKNTLVFHRSIKDFGLRANREVCRFSSSGETLRMPKGELVRQPRRFLHVSLRGVVRHGYNTLPESFLSSRKIRLSVAITWLKCTTELETPSSRPVRYIASDSQHWIWVMLLANRTRKRPNGSLFGENKSSMRRSEREVYDRKH
jgi:hypothetical protein